MKMQEVILGADEILDAGRTLGVVNVVLGAGRISDANTLPSAGIALGAHAFLGADIPAGSEYFWWRWNPWFR